jgi:tetratricopeptide (TPR) repeat protein
LRLLAQAKSR